MTSADLSARAAQCRTRVPMQLSFAAKRALERAADAYDSATVAPMNTRRLYIAQAEAMERLADQAAAMVARHVRR
jgi:hypothetical protein